MAGSGEDFGRLKREIEQLLEKGERDTAIIASQVECTRDYVRQIKRRWERSHHLGKKVRIFP
jgi:predicted DNA-binding ArsR family transcriptional regulator